MPENSIDVELAVLGSGPGGYAAAFQAAELGMKVALIGEDPRPGGVCLLRGCIPSKALLHIAKTIHEARDAKDAGITFGEPKIDIDKLRRLEERRRRQTDVRSHGTREEAQGAIHARAGPVPRLPHDQTRLA